MKRNLTRNRNHIHKQKNETKKNMQHTILRVNRTVKKILPKYFFFLFFCNIGVHLDSYMKLF